jgi:hypothetical protein
MKTKSIVFAAALAAIASIASAQQGNFQPRTQMAPACRSSELKACKDKCRQDYDYDVKKLCASGDKKTDDSCRNVQSKTQKDCNTDCQKAWCS